MIEELTLRQNDTGVYLSAYRLDASTGIAGVILQFRPAAAVLLAPTSAKPGTTWPFDLGTSADGCATAKGTGEVLDPGDGTSTLVRRFRLTTSLHTVGPALCVALEGERTEEIRHPVNTLLPNEIDSDMRGTVAGGPFTARTRATRAAGPQGGTAQELRPAPAAQRIRT
jgi:hypothetical protein